MKREIEFRGKRKDNGEFIFGSLSMGGGAIESYDKNKTFIEPNTIVLRRIEVDPETVGQYIDRKDSKGDKIYEGDKVVERNASEITKEEYWNPEFIVRRSSWSFFLEYIGGGKRGDSHEFSMCHYSSNFEIIGTIHDNPELLEIK